MLGTPLSASYSDVSNLADPFDPKAWLDALFQILKLIFPVKVPDRLLHLIGYLLATGFALVALWGLLYVLHKIKDLWIEHFWPLFYSREKRLASELRRRFADHIEVGVRRVNSLEQWSDHRYAELEAEIEAEGERKLPRLFYIFSGYSSIRREHSLSKALRTSKERLILLEGGPGSGKSIALRHLAQSMAFRATRTKRDDTVVPIYINLKELEVARGQEVNSGTIRAFVLQTLNRANDRDVEQFLDDRFEAGLADGTWLFLFDSFDEIPDVLSSVETDQTIGQYAGALADFLGGMSRCRGIIASREFRGPSQLGWPRFRVLPLSQERQNELIRRAALPEQENDALLMNLHNANAAIQEMLGNPMFLGLLVEHLRGGNAFPQNSHVVFERYVQGRLERDAKRVESKFGVGLPEVRSAAENVAFCMAADLNIGLSPSRSALKESLARLDFAGEGKLDIFLDALEYTKLARSDYSLGASGLRPFTFAHRRFQEYFATCVVLRETGRVGSRQLLTDGRWREAAVVLCQNQPHEALAALVGEIDGLLRTMNQQSISAEGNVRFQWPVGAVHLLGILQDGFAGRVAELPEEAREHVGSILTRATQSGLILDKKWALEVAGTAPPALLLGMIRSSISSSSQWLREIAYWQMSRLREIPVDVASWVRLSLVKMACSGRLFREKAATRAHLARLPDLSFASVARLLVWSPVIDLLLLCGLALSEVNRPFTMGRAGFSVCAALLVPFAGWWTCCYAPVAGWGEDPSFSALTWATVLFRAFPGFLLVSRTHGLLPRFYVYYALAWAPSALVSARFGDFVEPAWWPFQPFRPLLHFLRDTRARFGQITGEKSFRTLLGTIAMYGVVYANEKLHPFTRLFRWISTLPGMRIVWIVLRDAYWLVCGGFIAFGMGVAALAYIRDYMKLRRFLESTDDVGVTDVLSIISTLDTELFRARFLRSVRQRGQLRFSPATVEELAGVISRSSWGPAADDEANKLLEQLQSKTTQANSAVAT